MNHNYRQSRDESVVLLRLVIAEMSQHDAPFNPATFAVCYEHLAGINPRLTQAIVQAKQVQPRLDAEAMALLYRDHLAPADELTTEKAQADLQRMMHDVAESAAATGAHARAYGDQLAGLSKALDGTEHAANVATLKPKLSEVAGGTAEMQTVMAALERSATESRNEVERLRRALERSRKEASTDPLSKLRNRKGFDDAMREVLSTLPQAGLTHCLVIIDIDHFKRVNDTYGHPVGDTVIQTIGQVLARVAGTPSHFAARIGGEEFAVLMQATTVPQALQLAEGVRSLVHALKIKKRGTQEVIASVTVSAGIAAWVPGEDDHGLLAKADAALYRAKQGGRDRVSVA
jgi:diguanylate cyclase